MKRLLITVLVFFAFAAVLSAEHPNDAKGFSPDRVYSVHDVDTVNAFNGNMIIRIPIGPVFKVNGSLTYGLTLTYNSHLWRYLVFPPPDEGNGGSTVAFPTGTDNAGLGWRLSLGKLYDQGDPDITAEDVQGWVYQGSDGADHNFHDTLTSGLTASTAATQYTRDGSYIRLSSVDGTTKHVEFPDGTVQTFKQLVRGTWQESATSHQWFLSRIADPFGNSVNVSYSSNASFTEIWTITDVARTTAVYFKSGLTSDFTTTLDHVDTKAVGGSTLSYGFAIQVVNDIPPGNGDTTGRATVLVPVLTAINPSAGNGYSMMISGAHPNDPPVHAYDTSVDTPGVLKHLVLPTLGAVGWSYQPLRFGPGAIPNPARSPAIEHPSAVATRTTFDANGNALGTWTYSRNFGAPAFCRYPCGQNTCTSGRARQLTTFVTEPSTTDSTSPVKTTISYFSNYENVLDPKGDSCPTGPEGWVHTEHGLPFTRYKTDPAGRFLSSEVRTGYDASVLIGWDGHGQLPAYGTPLRETYVTYELDADASADLVHFDHNARLNSTATYYIDDKNQSDGCGSVPCFTAVNYKVFDAFGHYRQASADGNLPGTGNYRTTFTNYGATATSSSWLLTPFTEQCTVDESAARSTGLTGGCASLPGAFVTKAQFDAHGVVTARRTLLQSGGVLDPTDLLSTFTYDANGNITGEQYYGGDMQPIGTDTNNPFTPPANTQPAYAITHVPSYLAGALVGETASYSNGVSVLDETYDQWTGAVTDVRDISGLTTHYDYDLLGRITGVQPPGLTPASYAYTPASLVASVFNPAKVTAVTDASGSGLGSVRKEYQYDPFGRLRRQKSLLDDGSWSIVQNDYDVLGRKTAVSMPERLTGAESSFSPSHQTTYTQYDAFGRARTIQAPDGKTTSILFKGIRSIERTVDVATSAAATMPSVTTEIHDAVGRLYSVQEPSGPTSLASPAGAIVTTTYTYDSADHLTGVNTPPQNRSFTYDRRGFLTQETHPEIGSIGNGVIQYVYPIPNPTVGYDARGHAHGKLTGSMNGSLDLRFDYDPSERIQTIYDSGDAHRLLKEYSYWQANEMAQTPNLGRGKLYQAIRHNHPIGMPEVVVTETYTYATPLQSGRISKRDTLIESVSGSARTTLQSFTQKASYDQLGSTSQIDYPDCASAAPCSTPSADGPTFTHGNGFLVGVAGYASAITHNPDGSVFEITHDAVHGVKDTYTPDASGMGRPGVITFAGASSCAASAAVSGDATITSGQTTPIHASLGGTAPWSITWSDGVIESGIQQSSWTRNVHPTTTTTYTITSVTDATGCSGIATGSATVTVQGCNVSAAVSGGGNIAAGQSASLQVNLGGTAPWSITWSDGVTQTGIQQNPWTRNVSPVVTTTYTITNVTDAANCSHSGTGSAVVTVAGPTGLIATTLGNTLGVAVQWNSVPGAGWYQVERATRITLNDWLPIGGHVTSITVTDSLGATVNPTTYLYRVRTGATIGGFDATSSPSALDYATIATTLFTDERLVAGVTRIKGAHIGELRHAIDAVRYAAGLTSAWSSYAPTTGLVTAADNTTARQRLDEAVSILVGHGVTYSGQTPATNGRIWADQIQQIRDGVR